MEEPTQDVHNYMIFVVTNRHVFEGQSAVVVRFNATGSNPPKDYELTLDDGSGNQWWFAHPNPDVDIAVTPIDGERLVEDDIRFEYFRSHDNTLDRASALAADVAEGSSVAILGFPLGLVGASRNFVIARGGILARARDAWSGAMDEFLVDVSVFPGNSGGPVSVTSP